MLDIANTRFFQFVEHPIVSTASRDSIVEGSALVFKTEDGIGKVSIGTGSNDEQFAGVAFAGFTRPTVLTMSEELTIDASALTVSLRKVALSQPMVIIDGETAEAADAAAAGKFVFDADNNTVEFAAADADKKAVIVYRYTASLAEARAAAGDGYAGGFALTELSGTIGVIHQGQVATDQFDLTADWAAADVKDIKVNADGKFTIGGTGASVPNARLIKAPGFGSNYLILQLL